MATLNDRCTVIASRGASTAAWSHGSKARGTYEPFVLARLDGEMVDSADLEGKVAVLSISNDRTNEIIEDYLAKNNFDFTVREADDTR